MSAAEDGAASIAGELQFGVHTAGSVLFALAALPNLLLALAIGCRPPDPDAPDRRWRPLRWATGALATTNGVYCLAMSAYCLGRTAHFSPPAYGRTSDDGADDASDQSEDPSGCLWLTGFMLAFVHAPYWSALLLTSVLAVVSASGGGDVTLATEGADVIGTRARRHVHAARWLTDARLLGVRVGVCLLDVGVAALVVVELNARPLLLSTSAHCSFHVLVYRSKVFVIYRMFQLLSIAAVGGLSVALTLNTLSQRDKHTCADETKTHSSFSTRLRLCALCAGVILIVVLTIVNAVLCLSDVPPTVLTADVLSTAFVLTLTPLLAPLADRRLRTLFVGVQMGHMSAKAPFKKTPISQRASFELIEEVSVTTTPDTNSQSVTGFKNQWDGNLCSQPDTTLVSGGNQVNNAAALPNGHLAVTCEAQTEKCNCNNGQLSQPTATNTPTECNNNTVISGCEADADCTGKIVFRVIADVHAADDGGISQSLQKTVGVC